MTRWMLEGMKADVESILDNIGRLITGNLRMSLERSCEESCREAEA